MNAIKIEINTKLDDAETAREKNSKIKNIRKIVNFPVSPINQKIQSINLGNIKAHALPKNISNGNLSDKSILDNIKKITKQNSANNLNISNYNSKNNKEVKHLELKEKDINNFINFKILEESNNKLLFRNGMINNKIKSILFQNKNINNHTNILLKAKQKIINNFENSNIDLTNREINKIDITSIMELKNKPLIIKSDPKRSSSCLKGKKANELLKQIKNKNKVLSPKFVEDEEKNIIKTPTKRIFFENGRTKSKQSLSQLINIDKNNHINKKEKNEKIIPEENHFKAVLYSQEIKKLYKGLE